jgi:hypothetical protein
MEREVSIARMLREERVCGVKQLPWHPTRAVRKRLGLRAYSVTTEKREVAAAGADSKMRQSKSLIR